MAGTGHREQRGRGSGIRMASTSSAAHPGKHPHSSSKLKGSGQSPLDRNPRWRIGRQTDAMRPSQQQRGR